VNKLILISIFVFSVGCAQRIKVPINRMISPEAIGGGVDLKYEQLGFSDARLDFSNGETDNPLLMGSVSNRSLYMGFGVSENADFFVKVPQESSSLVGLKVQLAGAPSKARAEGHQLAFTVAVGAERDTFKGQFNIKLKSDVKDYSLIYGYRLNPMVLMYSSFSLGQYSFKGDIDDPNGLLLNDSISYRANNIIGAQGGVELGGDSFALQAEFGVQKLKWSDTPEKTLYFTAIALRTTF